MRIILIEGSLYSKIQGDDGLFNMALERHFGREAVVHYVDAGYGYCQNLSEAQSYDREDIIVTNNVLIWGNNDLCFDGDECFAYIYDGKYGEIFHITNLKIFFIFLFINFLSPYTNRFQSITDYHA